MSTNRSETRYDVNQGRVAHARGPLTSPSSRVTAMPTGKHILVVEDESDLAELLRFNIEREGFSCRSTGDGRGALQQIQASPPDLIVLDRMLPNTSGDEVLAQIRRDPRTARIPVILLTAKVEETDELVGFGLGADDYVSKPFSMKVLIARINAMLRRADAPTASREVFVCGPIRLDRGRHEVTVSDKSLTVTSTEFRILEALLAAGGRVLSRAQLIDAAMGHSVAVTDRTIDVHITALRKKLDAASSWIQTVRGVGYTLREPE